MFFLQQESIQQMAVLAIMSRSSLARDIIERNLQKTFDRNAPCQQVLSHSFSETGKAEEI